MTSSYNKDQKILLIVTILISSYSFFFFYRRILISSAWLVARTRHIRDTSYFHPKREREIHAIFPIFIIQKSSGIMVRMKPELLHLSFRKKTEDIFWDHLEWGNHGCLNHAHWPNAIGRWNTNGERYPLERQLGIRQERWTKDVWKKLCLRTPDKKHIIYNKKHTFQGK